MYIFGGCGKVNDGLDDFYFNDLYYLEIGIIIFLLVFVVRFCC